MATVVGGGVGGQRQTVQHLHHLRPEALLCLLEEGESLGLRGEGGIDVGSHVARAVSVLLLELEPLGEDGEGGNVAEGGGI